MKNLCRHMTVPCSALASLALQARERAQRELSAARRGAESDRRAYAAAKAATAEAAAASKAAATADELTSPRIVPLVAAPRGVGFKRNLRQAFEAVSGSVHDSAATVTDDEAAGNSGRSCKSMRTTTDMADGVSVRVAESDSDCEYPTSESDRSNVDSGSE